MSALHLSGVGHAYLGRTVVDGIDLSVERGEVLSLVGPSGCGKSTLLHIAAGIIEPSRGHASRRYERHGMVFQEPRLLPWATALDNVAYPLRLGGLGHRVRREQAAAAARSVELADEDLMKFPVELSGGMKQRVAIARALVRSPDFVFFDEPFTALDVALKRRMQDLVIEAARRTGFTALFVTHDLSEAVRVSHRIAIMDARGKGIVGQRTVEGVPGKRQERQVFELVMKYLHDDPLFKHVNDIDERGS